MKLAASSGSMVIRLAEWDDLPALVAIERASFSDPWSPDSFASALFMDRMLVLVAEERTEGQGSAPILLGYVLALLLGEEAEVADLAVSPAARRRGIGAALLDRMLADLATRGVDSVFLEVRESNAGARSLYEGRGFDAVGRRPGYYRLPVEDALILKRRIEPT